MTAPATAFRKWLIQQLQRTRWVRLNEPAEVTAQRLGVTPAVLLEARAEHAQDVERGELGYRIMAENIRYTIEVPKAVHAEWMRRCSLMRVESSAALRTLIHHFLLSRDGPDPSIGWKLHGQRYRVARQRGGVWKWRIRPKISRGAFAALKIRAERGRTTATALVRAQAIKLLEDPNYKMPRVVTPEQMHVIAEKYWLGKK